MGRIVPELENEDIRELIYRDFRIKLNILEIARIMHGSRIITL
jgi:hypothetical protein